MKYTLPLDIQGCSFLTFGTSIWWRALRHFNLFLWSIILEVESLLQAKQWVSPSSRGSSCAPVLQKTAQLAHAADQVPLSPAWVSNSNSMCRSSPHFSLYVPRAIWGTTGTEVLTPFGLTQQNDGIIFLLIAWETSHKALFVHEIG